MSPSIPIDLDRSSPEPLYRQVALSIRGAIDDGLLRPHQRVPSVRALATQLGVGRLTVATAYDPLTAEGYLVGRVGSGTTVAPDPPRSPTATGRGRAATAQGRPDAAGARLPLLRALPTLAARGSDAFAGSRTPLAPRFDLRSSTAAGWSSGGDAGLAVGATLERLLRDEFRQVSERGGGDMVDPAGDARLRSVIAGRLRAARGIRCEADHIVILSGAPIGFGVIGRLFLGAGRRLVVEDPGEPQIRRALLASGGDAIGIAVDGQGLRADLLPDRAEVAIVAPAVQIPTGAALPLARRLRLLAWAATTGALVVEDARFDEFLLRSAPIPGLAALDDDGRVIQIGSFETLLHRGIRTAFAVLPPPLVEPFVRDLQVFDAGASPVQQRALARFIEDGLLDRHLARVRRALLDRQNAAVGAIQRELGWLVDARPTSGGTRIVVTIEDATWTAHEVTRVAAAAGIAIDGLDVARLAPAPDRELIVDYGRTEPIELRAAMRVLGRALRSAANDRRRPIARSHLGLAVRA